MTERYRVRQGDNLWTIARTHLGRGADWPRIWRYNNRRDVIARTGRGIPDPDIIFPDQILLLPVLPGSPTAPASASPRSASSTPGAHGRAGAASGEAQPLRSSPTASNEPLSRQLPHIQSPMSFKYKLDDLKLPPVVQPGVVLEMKMTGDVILVSRKMVPALYVTSRHELELQMTTQANHAFGSLVNDTRLIYDDMGKKLTYRSMLVSQSKTPGTPATAIGVEMNSQSPIPKLRFEIRLPKLEGNVEDFVYVAQGVTIVVEMTPTPRPPSGPSAQPLRVPQTAPVPATNWRRVLGTGLVITAGVVVVATLVEDFFTVGAGIADDPVSFAAAGASFARGMAMIRGAAVLLPRAAIPATAVMTITVTAPGSHAGHR